MGLVLHIIYLLWEQFKLKYILIIHIVTYIIRPDALRPECHAKISYVPMPRAQMG